MSVLIRDDGFAPDDWQAPIVPLAEWTGDEAAVDVAPADDLSPLESAIAAALRVSESTRESRPASPALGVKAPDHGLDAGTLPRLIRVAFPKFNDGRGFTVARRLRRMGYAGRLRAAGHVIADQYTMARRSGFDEVEIDDALAARQPEPQWLARADWRAHDYRSRLGF